MRRHFSKKAGGVKFCKNAGCLALQWHGCLAGASGLFFARSQYLDAGSDWQAMGHGFNAFVMGR